MKRCLALIAALTLLPTGVARAQGTDPSAPPAPDPDPAPAAAAPAPSPVGIVQVPPANPPPLGQAAPAFRIEPVADIAIIAIGGGFAGLLELINGTGELRPQQISSTFDAKSLISIDRGAISQSVDKNAATYSNVGMGAAVAFAVLDPILSGVREGEFAAGLVDATLYAESVAITEGLTNLAKIAVRRPRPLAYVDAAQHKNDPTYSNADTDSSLSFFSGHASTVGTIAATATYLAFARSSTKSIRPWLTLGLGAALTTFVSFERVRAGKHFPTDVIAGAMVGGGVGILVPHLHRNTDAKPRTLWIAGGPAGEGGGTVTVSGAF